RLMNTAASTYNTIFGNGFPPSMAGVGGTGANTVTLPNAEFIDRVLTAGTKSVYPFVLVPGATQLTGTSSSCAAGFGYSDGYEVTATPIGATTGKRTFCSDASGEIRVNPASIAAYSTPNCT